MIMNIYSKNYNIYTSRQENSVSSNYLDDPVLLETLWNVFCDTIKNIELWQQAPL